MTIEEMGDAIEKYCDSREFCVDENEGRCPLLDVDGECYECPEFIKRNYNILVDAGFIKPKINFTKVNPNPKYEAPSMPKTAPCKQGDDEVTRKAILETATKYVCSDRNDQYGSPEDSFKAIAELWSAYLGKPITAKDVAAMMVLFKMARVKTGTAKADNWIDAAGYCACGGECEAKGDS